MAELPMAELPAACFHHGHLHIMEETMGTPVGNNPSSSYLKDVAIFTLALLSHFHYREPGTQSDLCWGWGLEDT